MAELQVGRGCGVCARELRTCGGSWYGMVGIPAAHCKALPLKRHRATQKVSNPRALTRVCLPAACLPRVPPYPSQAHRVVVNEESTCRGCQRPQSTRVFYRYPSGVVLCARWGACVGWCEVGTGAREARVDRWVVARAGWRRVWRSGNLCAQRSGGVSSRKSL